VRRIVCAHELGHDVLHQHLAKQGAIQEFVMYDMTGRPEYEANVFAAHLLLDEDEIIEYAKQGYDTHQIAMMMHTDVNLMLIKMGEMKRDGYQLRLMYTPRGDFLR
jgi:Zn-dependent peptidase ImmA (M78 family)